MNIGLRVLIVIAVVAALALGLAAALRVSRVTRAAAAIPVYPGAREGGGRTRYFPHLFDWNDASSARVQRVFAFDQALSLAEIGRKANAVLAPKGWYLIMPGDLERLENPQTVVWQRDPDERLDLVQVWPLGGMSREQRLYGGIFPAEFLDAPLVIQWDWALGGPRSQRPVQHRPIMRRPPPPPPPPGP